MSTVFLAVADVLIAVVILIIAAQKTQSLLDGPLQHARAHHSIAQRITKSFKEPKRYPAPLRTRSATPERGSRDDRRHR